MPRTPFDPLPPCRYRGTTAGIAAQSDGKAIRTSPQQTVALEVADAQHQTRARPSGNGGINTVLPRLARSGTISLKAVTPIRSAEQVTDLIDSLEAWSIGRDYSETGRKKLVEADRTLSNVPLKVLEAGFKACEAKGFDPDRAGKAFVLMRVLFELPASRPHAEARYFAGYAGLGEGISADEPWTPSWPLQWTGNQLTSVGMYNTYNGSPYRMLSEFRFFSEKFKRRVRFKD